EPTPARAGRSRPAGAARRGASARGGDGVEQAAAAPPQRAADQLLSAAPAHAPGAERPPERVRRVMRSYLALWVRVMPIAFAASSYLATDSSCLPALCSASPSAASVLAL